MHFSLNISAFFSHSLCIFLSISLYFFSQSLHFSLIISAFFSQSLCIFSLNLSTFFLSISPHFFSQTLWIFLSISLHFYEISGSRREVTQNCVILGNYTADNGDSLPMFGTNYRFNFFFRLDS